MSLVRLLSCTDRASFDCRVVALRDGPCRKDLEALGVPVTALNVDGVFDALPALFRLVRIVRESAPDIIQSWLYHADLFALAAQVFAPATRMIWSVRNSSFSVEGRRDLAAMLGVLARLSTRVDAAVANAEAGRRDHAAIGYRPKAWRVIPNGWDAAAPALDASLRRDVRAELGVGPDEVAILLPARLARQKDHATYLRAAALAGGENPGLRFFAAGQGVSPEALRAVAAMGDPVTALGERADLPRLLRGVDAVTLSSSYGEGCPNAIGEGMAAGLPAIATDVGGVRDLVADTGLVVPPSDPAALARAYVAFGAMTPETRRGLGALARSRIATHYPLTRTAGAYEALYRDLVGRPAPLAEPARHIA